jgi:hypothetical protein
MLTPTSCLCAGCAITLKKALPRRRRSIPILVGLLLLLATASLAACFGGGGGQNVNNVLNETFGGNKKISSGRLNMSLTADLEGIPQVNGPVTVKIGGPFESRGQNQVPRLDLDLTASAGGQSFEAGAVSTGEKGFVSFQGTDYAVPDKTFAQFTRELKRAQKGNKNQPDLSALGVHPRQWLKNPSDKGTEDVNGDKTIHIAADVDVAKLLDDIDSLLKKTGELGLTRAQQAQLPTSISASVKKQIVDSVTEARFDVFAGKDDKILRKLEVKLKFDVPKSLRAQAGGLKKGSIDFSVDVAELNKPQAITEPKNARPLSELQSQLGANALGTLGSAVPGGSSSAGASGGGSGAGSSSSGADLGGGGGAPQVSKAQARRYLKCVQKASGAAAIQSCAELLK